MSSNFADNEYDHQGKEWEDMCPGERDGWVAEYVFGVKPIVYPFVCDTPFSRAEDNTLIGVPEYTQSHEHMCLVIKRLTDIALLRVFTREVLRIRTCGAAVSDDEEYVKIDMHALGHVMQWTCEDAGRALWNMKEHFGL